MTYQKKIKYLKRKIKKFDFADGKVAMAFAGLGLVSFAIFFSSLAILAALAGFFKSFTLMNTAGILLNIFAFTLAIIGFTLSPIFWGLVAYLTLIVF